jgi:hypothetical protein
MLICCEYKNTPGISFLISLNRALLICLSPYQLKKILLINSLFFAPSVTLSHPFSSWIAPENFRVSPAAQRVLRGKGKTTCLIRLFWLLSFPLALFFFPTSSY